MEKLILIDGNSFMNRYYYGIPEMVNSKGTHINALYGFLKMIFSTRNYEKPDYIGVAFDVHYPTFRHDMYSEYKSNRTPSPDALREQISTIKILLNDEGIMIMLKEGYEGDDILGTMAKKAKNEGVQTYIYTGDHDLLQIVDDNIFVRIPKTKNGETTIEEYDTERLLGEYHCTPHQFVELKALMGDQADNIPGVPKIGKKTAMGLIKQFGSIEGIYNHLDEIKKNSIRESLSANRNLCDLSLTLATIETNADIPYELSDLRVVEKWPKTKSYLDYYELSDRLEKFY